jgi:hypothetical protein
MTTGPGDGDAGSGPGGGSGTGPKIIRNVGICVAYGIAVATVEFIRRMPRWWR